MTKKEYLQQLYLALHHYSEEDRDEIMQEFEEHFTDGEAQGKTDAEIIAELGPVHDLVENIDSMTSGTTAKETETLEEDVTAIEINARKCAMDLTLEEGSELRVEFEPLPTLFGPQATLAKETRGNILSLTATNGKARMTITLSPEITEVISHGLSGDIETNDIHLNKLTLQTASGNVELNDTDCRKIKISTGSGNIEWNDSKAGKADLAAGSGNMKFNDCEIIGFKISLGSGDISFAGETETARIQTASGNMDIQLQNTPDTVKAAAASGDIEIHFANDDWHATCTTASGNLTSHHTTPVYKQKRFLEAGNGHAEVQCQTASGNIDLY